MSILFLLLSISVLQSKPRTWWVHHREAVKTIKNHGVVRLEVDEVTVFRRPLMIRVVNRTNRQVVFQPHCGRLLVRGRGQTELHVVDHQYWRIRKSWPKRKLPPGKPVVVCQWDLNASIRDSMFGQASRRIPVVPKSYSVLLGGELWVDGKHERLGGRLAASVRVVKGRVFLIGRLTVIGRNGVVTDPTRNIVIVNRCAVSKRTMDGSSFYRGDITVWRGPVRHDLNIPMGKHSDAVPGIRIYMKDVRPYRDGSMQLLVRNRP